MTLSGTASRFAVWADMAIEERLSWVQCPPEHPSATTIGKLRADGWPIPELPILVDSKVSDADLPVVASTALGPDEGREVVDRETFDAKLAEFEKQRNAAVEKATEEAREARKAHEAAVAAVNAVQDPNVKAALQAMLGNTNGKGKS